MASRRISEKDGLEAWGHWMRSQASDAATAPSRATVATAVRYTLALLSEVAPGASVEVRVAPYGATQAIEGTTHRRGTPPAVIEMDAQTWLRMASGLLTWDAAVDSPDVYASGEHADLSPYLPAVADRYTANS